MTVAATLLAGAALVAVVGPRLLWRLHRGHTDPLLLIVAWLLSIAGVLATVVAAIVLLLVPDSGVPGGLVRAVHGCWLALRSGSPPRVDEIVGVAGSIVVAGIAARLGLIGRRQAIRRRAARDQRLTVLRLAGRSDEADPSTLWLAHDRPLAFSLPGRSGLVVATDGLIEHLAPAEVFAVLEHERAHLRGHHHTLLAAAEAAVWALPFLPLLREAPAALRDLVELAADATAARRCGTRALRDALARVTDLGVPPAALAAGNHAVDLRLRRLADGRPIGGRWRRMLGAGLVGIVAVTAPIAVALTGFTLVALLV